MRIVAAVFVFLLFWNIPAINAQVTVKSADGEQVEINHTKRIITIGGSVTETVFALGFGDQVIATDQSSTFPPRVFSLPRVPYLRTLTSEGILALEPSLILASEYANPKTAIEQIRDAGTPVLLLGEEESIDGVLDKIQTLGEALGATEQAEALILENKKNYLIADSLVKQLKQKPKVLFILAVRGKSSFMASGNNTAAQKMIELAGGVNAFSDFDGFKNVSNESIMAANPDYILVMETRQKEIVAGLENTPGVNSLHSVKNNQVISMDGNYMLGFGPRFGEALLNLIQYLHPEIKI